MFINKNIIIILSIFIILLYIYCYFIFPSSITILQSTLNNFDFNLLLQRQPLVIGDRIIDINKIIDLWFSPNIIDKDIILNFNIWNKNNYKYLFIYSLENTEILLYQAGQKFINNIPDEKEPILAIKLKKNQSLIIPFKWYYNIKNNNIKIIGIHDYITYPISYII